MTPVALALVWLASAPMPVFALPPANGAQRPSAGPAQVRPAPPQGPATRAQLCHTKSIPAVTPTSDFELGADGTAHHKPTGLTWMRCALGQKWDGKTCTGTASSYDWQAALKAAVDFNAAGGYAGHKDWRVPNIKELDSIFELQCAWPAVNLTVFPATPQYRFWSSTAGYRYPKDYALYANFENSYTDDQKASDAYHVRLVRGGAGEAAFDAKVVPRKSATMGR